MTEKTIGQVAFEAFYKIDDPNVCSSFILEPWDSVREDTKRGWEAAAQAVEDRVRAELFLEEAQKFRDEGLGIRSEEWLEDPVDPDCPRCLEAGADCAIHRESPHAGPEHYDSFELPAIPIDRDDERIVGELIEKRTATLPAVPESVWRRAAEVAALLGPSLGFEAVPIYSPEDGVVNVTWATNTGQVFEINVNDGPAVTWSRSDSYHQWTCGESTPEELAALLPNLKLNGNPYRGAI